MCISFQLTEALEIVVEVGARVDIPIFLEFHAFLAGEQRQWDRALRIGGAASALRRPYGHPVTLGAQATLDQALARARVALGEQASTAAWNEGESMTLDQVVAIATSDGEG